MIDPAGRRWPWGIAAVLAITVAGNVAVYWAANDSNAAAVEPDYYRKAVEWDSTLAQGERNRRLGWVVEAGLAPGPAGGARALSLGVRDAAGLPVSGAGVDITAIHNTWAAEPVHATAVTDSKGNVLMDVPLRHDGLWELRLIITRGPDRFTVSLRRDAASRGAP
jgi:nitrogen fixation protein FixH